MLWHPIGRSRRHRERIFGGTTYYINDEFSSGDAVSPRTCTPGPGTLTITDTAAGTVVVGGGVMTVTGSGTYGETVVTGSAITRLPGVIFDCDINIAALNAMFFIGLQDTAAVQTTPVPPGGGVEYALKFDSAETIDVILESIEVGSDVQNWAAATQYRVRFELKAAGCTISISGGAFGALGTAWTQLLDTNTNSDSPLYPVFNARLAVAVALDNFKVYLP
jgi:hypothetical protein